MDPTALTAAQFRDFSRLISERLGIKMPDTKQVMLQSRIQRRARLLELDGPREYHRRFFSDVVFQEAEMQDLFNLATTNKTDFLREPAHFRFLTSELVTRHLLANKGRELRLWCAGCSTGEEPYTLAMVLLEERKARPFEFSIVATDISTRALRAAMAAEYDHDHVAVVPEAWRRSYFEAGPAGSKGKVHVVEAVRRHVTFGHLNFLANQYRVPGPFDVIFFRNVMIYFERETQREVVAKMLPHLRLGGHLLTAHAETLHGLGLPFRQRATAVYQKCKDAETAEVNGRKETAPC